MISDVAREFIAYYTGPERHPSGGCGNCGGISHSTTCFVGRFIAALESASYPPRVPLSEEGKAIGSAPQSSSSPVASGTVEQLREKVMDFKRGTVYADDMHDRDEVDTIHKTLNVVLAEIDTLSAAPPTEEPR